ncbi:hypothetical protein LI328DRAFT_163579 [Trichoderma asperelloides]|nr:hypothetical protein LI328DRAFT_163579 [Trichoderma asperelloides]
MASPVIYNHGCPVQFAHPGPFTCTQSICSDTACADNSLEDDISFLGLTMQCDSDSTVYPFMSCTCSQDFVNCDDNGVKEGEGSPSVDGASGYATDTTLVGKRGGGTAGGGAQDSRTKTTPTAPSSPASTAAAGKCFGAGLGWQLRIGLVALVSAVLTL